MSYVLNAWYVAALADEVTPALMSRTILDNPTLLYRENGRCVALLDLCPHRFAPLSMGMIKDGNVQCPYHGLEFDGTGRCVHNPHGNGATPSALNVRAFPVVERDGLLWIWPGAAAHADASKIPDYGCRVEPERRTVGGHTTVDCNFRVLVDNLMDLGHAQYVHRANAQTDAFHGVKREVKVETGAVHNLMTFPSAAPSPLVQKLLGGTNQPVEQWTDIRWTPVSAMLNFIGFAVTGTPKAASLNSMGTHIVTPETATSCHYFFGASRNFALEDSAVDDTFRAWQKQALMAEDKPIAEAIERGNPVVRRLKLAPAMLACDEAAVRVNREIDKLLLAEAA